MATIEPRQETVVKETFVVTFESREELQAMLDDAQPFLRDIRAVLRGLDKPESERLNGNRRLNGHRKGKARRGKVDARLRHSGMTKRNADGEKGVRGGHRCRWCAKRFKREGNKINHEATCAQRDIGTVPVPSAD